MSLTLRQPAPGLIIHADHVTLRCHLQQPVHQPSLPPTHRRRGGVGQLRRPDNPYDNAQAEAGWRTLKTELLPHGRAFTSLEEARPEVACYLDTYLHLDRRHSALVHRSPHQFETDLL